MYNKGDIVTIDIQKAYKYQVKTLTASKNALTLSGVAQQLQI
jgi:hypothetical protein